jgi:glycosyltransferase involved in cell wall biosynthesis
MAVRGFHVRAAFSPVALSRLKTHLRRLQCDVLHVHLSKASIRGPAAALAAGPAAATVSTVHGAIRFRSIRQVRAALARSDAVIAVSHASAERLARTGASPPEKIRFIPYGLDLEAFDRGTRPTELRRGLGLPDEVRLVVSVVRRASSAQLRKLVLAAHALSRRFPEFVLLLVGLGGSQERKLRRLVTKLRLGHTVVTTGWREDTAAVMKEADILMVSSAEEDSAYLVLEGLAAGIPTVAPRGVSAADIVLDEATGVLFEPDTSDALAASLARLLSAPELARLMGSTGRTRVETDFSAQRMVGAVETLYDELLSRPAEKRP